MQKKEKLAVVGKIQTDSFESMQGELQFKNEYGNPATGSGCMLLFKSGEPFQWKACVLTAASNLVSVKYQGLEKKINENKELRYVYSSLDTFNQFGTFEGGNIDWFEEFSGQPETGNNIGLVWLKNAEKVFETNAPNAKNLCWDQSIEELKIQKGEKICVIGFGTNKIDLLYKMESQLINIKNTNNGNYILYYDSIQRHGLEGSPVLLNRNQMYYIIGIHNGTDSTKKYGYGTGMNQKILQWIRAMHENQMKI